jgi:GNAT superfamily N-acetyltransferase
MSSSLLDLAVRPARPEDAEAVAELTTAYDLRWCGVADTSAEDILDDWRGIDLERDTWLWELDGRVAAFGVLFVRHERLHSDGYVHPELLGRGFGSAILERMEARARELGFDKIGAATLAGDEAGLRLFESRGYRDVRHFFRMAIELDAPPPEPSWPAGLEPRPVEHEQLRVFQAAKEEAFAEEWGYVPESFEAFEVRVIERPRADLSLWTAVSDGDEIAATLIAGCELGGGWIASIGVRKPWRRRGLGLALLQRSFGQLWERGERRVQLGVDAGNETGAIRLYERAGMHVVWEAVVYGKELEP